MVHLCISSKIILLLKYTLLFRTNSSGLIMLAFTILSSVLTTWVFVGTMWFGYIDAFIYIILRLTMKFTFISPCQVSAGAKYINKAKKFFLHLSVHSLCTFTCILLQHNNILLSSLRNIKKNKFPIFSKLTSHMFN